MHNIWVYFIVFLDNISNSSTSFLAFFARSQFLLLWSSRDNFSSGLVPVPLLTHLPLQYQLVPEKNGYLCLMIISYYFLRVCLCVSICLVYGTLVVSVVSLWLCLVFLSSVSVSLPPTSYLCNVTLWRCSMPACVRVFVVVSSTTIRCVCVHVSLFMYTWYATWWRCSICSCLCACV